MKLLTVHKENFINVVENANDDLTANYVDVFNKGLGTLPGKVTLQVDPDCLLSFQQEKFVSVREKFKEELQRLERLKVITLLTN